MHIKREYKLKEFYDEYFIKSGYFNRILTFEEIFMDISDIYPDIGPMSLKKIKYQLELAQKINGKYFAPSHEHAYALELWAEIITRIAENKLKELEEYELTK